MHSKQILNYFAVSEAFFLLFLTMLLLCTKKKTHQNFARFWPNSLESSLTPPPPPPVWFSTWLLHDSEASNFALQLPDNWKNLFCRLILLKKLIMRCKYFVLDCTKSFAKNTYVIRHHSEHFYSTSTQQQKLNSNWVLKLNHHFKKKCEALKLFFCMHLQ